MSEVVLYINKDCINPTKKQNDNRDYQKLQDSVVNYGSKGTVDGWHGNCGPNVQMAENYTWSVSDFLLLTGNGYVHPTLYNKDDTRIISGIATKWHDTETGERKYFYDEKYLLLLA